MIQVTKHRPSLLVAGCCLALLIPRPAAAQWLPPDEVFVQVRWSGWHVGLDAAGHLGFIGDETEATGPLKSASIDPAVALGFLDRLVGAGIMTMEKRYRSTRGKLVRGTEGRVGWFSDMTMDGGRVQFLMVIGEDRNTVKIELPMRQMPCGIGEWLQDFKILVAEELFSED